VTLSASNATVSQILAEWARIGQTRIINGEKVTGAPLTIELADVPEAEALDILLRSTGGYLLAPRATAVSTASRFDRILIVPTTSGTRAPASPPSPVPQAIPQPRFNPPLQQDDNDVQDDQAGRFNVVPQPPVRRAAPVPPPVMMQNPPAMQNAPVMSFGTRPAATPTPGAPTGTPAGVPVPGMMVPAPAAAPAQPGMQPPQQEQP
jgi:hypothetical protein